MKPGDKLMIFILCDGFTENLGGFNLDRLGPAMPYCFIYWIFDKYKALQRRGDLKGFGVDLRNMI